MTANIYTGGLIGAKAVNASGIWGIGPQGLTYGDLNYVATVLADGPLGFWLLNETSGTTAATQIGSDTLTYQNAPTLGAVGPSVSIPAAVTLNGTDENAYSNNSATFTTTAASAWSWEVWFKSTSASSSLSLGVVRDTAGTGTTVTCGMLINFSGTALTGFSVDTGGATIAISGGTGVNDGNWHHAVLTAVAAGTMTLYLDGTSVASSASGRSNTSSQRSINVGSNRSGVSAWLQWFPGSLAAAAYYNTALTGTRITAHYNAGKP